jgi:hypothetical protein
MPSVQLIGILAVHDNYDEESCLGRARTWQRGHLRTVAHGLAGRPCNKGVEMIDDEKAHGR